MLVLRRIIWLIQVELVKGKSITLTTDDQYKEKCTAEMLYLDYKNIVKVGINK